MILVRFAALASGVLILAGCGQEPEKAPPAPAAQIAPAVAGQTGTAQAIACMTYLSLQQAALEAQTPPADATAVRAALNDWEGLALRSLSEDDVAMQFVSSIAVAGRTPPATVEVTAAWCQAHKPA